MQNRGKRWENLHNLLFNPIVRNWGKKNDSYNSDEARKSSKNETLKTSDAYIKEPHYFKQ